MSGAPGPRDYDPLGNHAYEQSEYLRHTSEAKAYERKARKAAARGDVKKAHKLAREGAKSATLARLLGERLKNKRRN